MKQIWLPIHFQDCLKLKVCSLKVLPVLFVPLFLGQLSVIEFNYVVNTHSNK